MNKTEFRKFNFCLELLAVKDIISDKKKLLKYKIFNYYSEEELNRFIEMAERRKKILKDFIKDTEKLNYNDAIRFAKENKEKYMRLYNLHHMNHHNSILDYIRNNFEEYLNSVERFYKKEAKEILESLVNE